MATYVRVRDRNTGHEYSVRENHFNPDAHERLERSGLDAHGDPAAPKFRVKKGARTRKASTPKPVPASTPESDDNGQPADSEEEK